MRFGILVSGRGTNLQALIDARARGELAPAELAVVVANIADIPALTRADEAGIPKTVVDHRGLSREDFETKLLDVFAAHDVEAVILAGFMRVLTAHFLAQFPARIINTHPSLLPAFPGIDAPAQAIAHGVKISGVTIHFVDASLDGGPIIAQAAIPVEPTDDAVSLHARIQLEEHRLLPACVRRLAAGELTCHGRVVTFGERVPSNSYDLVVLGDDLPALVCATLCARRGLRTLVLGDERPARYQLGPHKLPIEPLVWASAPGSAGERVLKELHAELALRRKLREPKIPAQLVGPDLRIDLGVDRLPAELAREVGKEPAAAWIARWDRGGELARQLDPMLSGEHAVPGVGFFEKRELAKLADRAASDADAWWTEAATDPSSALWKALAAIALRHPSASPIAIARAVDAWRTGPSAMRGDGDALRELLLEKLTTAGGEVRSGALGEMSVSWSKITSITLANGDELGAGQVVASRPPSELAELLGKKAPKRLAELAASMSIVAYRYTLNVVLDEAGLPEHMAPTVAVIAAANKEPSGDAAFSIHLGEADDTGRVIATIAALLPADGALEPERLVTKCMALRAGLWKRLGDVMPFFERHLVLAHSPFEATPPQVPGGRGSYDVPRNLPLAMTPVWSGTADTAIDRLSGGALTYTTGLKNLTLTGEQMLPSLGIEGAMAAGWSAAKVACAIAGKKKDYLRDETVGAA